MFAPPPRPVEYLFVDGGYLRKRMEEVSRVHFGGEGLPFLRDFTPPLSGEQGQRHRQRPPQRPHPPHRVGHGTGSRSPRPQCTSNAETRAGI